MKTYEKLNNQLTSIKSNADYNKFLYSEIDELNLQNNEEEGLEQEFMNLKNYDKLKNELNEINVLNAKLETIADPFLYIEIVLLSISQAIPITSESLLKVP